MAWDEERRFDVVLVEQLEHAADTDATGEEATGNVTGTVLAAVGSEPSCNGVDVD